MIYTEKTSTRSLEVIVDKKNERKSGKDGQEMW